MAVVGLVVVLASVKLALVEALGVALDVVGLVGLVGFTGSLLVDSGIVTGKVEVAAAVVLVLSAQVSVL